MKLALIAAVAALLAPGRVVLPHDDFAIQDHPDLGGGAIATMLPDGRALFLRGGGLETLGRTGAVEARVPLAIPPGSRPFSLLRGADGRTLLVLTAEARSKYETDQLQVMDVATGAVGSPGIQIGCGACEVAAVAPDGSVFLAGSTGQVDPSIERDPNAPNSFRWVVAKLTPQLALDPSFGSGGVATLPVESAHGFGVALLDDGRVATYGQAGRMAESRLQLARLTRSGGLDPSFNGGAPLRTDHGSGFVWHVRGDGAIDLAPSAPHGRLVRFAPDGALAAVTDLGAIDVQELLPEPGGSVLAAGYNTANPDLGGAGELAVVRPGGPVRVAPLPFGGGLGGSLRSNSLRFFDILRRPDGSFLIAGGVGVARYTGEGVGVSTGGHAFASLTPDLRLESGFGGPQTAPRLAVAVPRQRPGRAGVRVRVTASTPGVVELRLRMSGRVVGKAVIPVLATKPFTQTVRVSPRYRRGLRRGATVTVQARMRDLLQGAASASARGRMR
jgi:hypothetical protein